MGKNLFNLLDEIVNEDINISNNILFVGHSSGTVVDLMSVCPPYDTSDENSYYTAPFKMEGEIYDGFSLKSGYYSESYVLINLKGEFSNIEFDFGHIDGTVNYECTLNVYMDDKLIQTIEQNPDSPILHMGIPLNYTGHLKLGISGNWVEYGFGNIKLQY